jgi:hypothetical protein
MGTNHLQASQLPARQLQQWQQHELLQQKQQQLVQKLGVLQLAGEHAERMTL